MWPWLQPAPAMSLAEVTGPRTGSFPIWSVDFSSGQPVLIRRPNAIRPWQHVLESLHGYLMLAQQLLAQPARFASAYNFGPSDEDVWPVERIANKLVQHVGQRRVLDSRFRSQRA